MSFWDFVDKCVVCLFGPPLQNAAEERSLQPTEGSEDSKKSSDGGVDPAVYAGLAD